MTEGWRKEFSSFKFIDRMKALTEAALWMEKHKDHVDSILKEGERSYPPCGSDCFKPELWKSCHWRWFKELIDQGG